MAKSRPASAATRRVRTIIDESQVPPDPETLEQEGELENEFEQEIKTPLELALEEMGGAESSQFTVFRLVPTEPNGRVFCGSLPPGLTDSVTILSEVQKNYGGGKYMLQIRTKGGTFANRVIVSVAEREKETPPAPIQVQESVAAALRPVMETLQKVVEANQRPAFNLQKFIAEIGPLLPMFMAFFKNFTGQQHNDPLAQLQQLAQFRNQMRALGMNFGEGEDGGGGTKSTVDTLLELFNAFGKPLIERMQQQPPQIPPAGTVHPGVGRPTAMPSLQMPMAGRPAARPMPSPPNPLAAVPPVLRPYIPAVAQLAAAGALPEMAAETILRAVPDEHIDALCEALENGTLIGAISGLPEFNGHAAWLQAVSGAILASVDVDEGQDADVSRDGVTDQLSQDS